MSLSTLIYAVIDFEDPTDGWNHVRSWFTEHSIDETKLAVELKDEFGATVLHVACRNVPPLDVVEVMIAAAPDMVFWSDSFGWLPVHYACANGADIGIVKLLVDKYPESRITMDKRGRIPLHFALGNVDSSPTVSMVKLLIGNTAESVKWPDENNMIPIHYACAYGASVEVVEALIEACEESMTKRDSSGRNALHFAMANADRVNCPNVVKLLLQLDESNGLDTADDDNDLPLHLLDTKAEAVDESDIDSRENIQKCLELYLDSDPKMMSGFLTGIQHLPEWLRDLAVIHPNVQTMINAKITSRFPTMILMLDFYFLAAVIGAFYVTALQSIERRFNPSNTTQESRSVSVALLSPVYIGALYFLLRETAEMISIKNQATISTYLFNAENILNLTYVFLVIFYSILMQTGLGDDENFRIGAALTIGVCWNQVLSYLKSILIDFAVFVSGVVFVTPRLSPFLICLIITVLAFSQMWYTLFRFSSECLENVPTSTIGEVVVNSTNMTTMDDTYLYYDDEVALLLGQEVEDCEPTLDYPFCTSMWASIYRVFTMMLGETDDGPFRWNVLALVLFCLFFFLVPMLLLNIMIAIICDLYGVITNERAAIVFWSNKLSFINSMEVITNGPWKEKVQSFFRIQDYEDDESSVSSIVKNPKAKVLWDRVLWKQLVEFFDPVVDGNHSKMLLLMPIQFIISMLVLPFWMMMGILSAGWLWPPQLHESLFVEKVSFKDSSQVEGAEQRLEEVAQLRNELSAVQEELIEEFMDDRKKMALLKEQVDAIRNELKTEVKNIKIVMNSLVKVKQAALSF